jgi:hypothetical protein
MILVSSRSHHAATECAPAMMDRSAVLPGFPAVGGKPVHVASDGGQLTSDAGVLLLAEIDRRLGIAKRLANCLEDPRDPAAIRHSFAEMIRFRALLIACGSARSGRALMPAEQTSDHPRGRHHPPGQQPQQCEGKPDQRTAKDHAAMRSQGNIHPSHLPFRGDACRAACRRVPAREAPAGGGHAAHPLRTRRALTTSGRHAPGPPPMAITVT